LPLQLARFHREKIDASILFLHRKGAKKSLIIEKKTTALGFRATDLGGRKKNEFNPNLLLLLPFHSFKKQRSSP
jgi:hypothetical protein